jgi:hypothetical protein
MRKQFTQFLAGTAIAVSAVTVFAAPSMAATTLSAGPVGASHAVRAATGSNPVSTVSAPVVHGIVPGPANSTQTSRTSRNAWNMWNNSAGDLGKGAAGLVSSAFFGIPSFIINTLQSLLHLIP